MGRITRLRWIVRFAAFALLLYGGFALAGLDAATRLVGLRQASVPGAAPAGRLKPVLGRPSASQVVLPAALPGILTGAILGLSRAAGETAPIMFTAAVFYTPTLPTSPFSKIMALPYHIYVLATAGTNIEATRPLQYGTALVLIVMVLGMNLVAIVWRARLRKRMK